ncbi:MAG: NAD(P)H-dependent glycerol-3-phosphate dehydrogenase [Bacteroidetes bacterium]|nr:MAG: NAD(P)H-dependent glycerol-3-phosphate dehydrogenase [Bacteroidota bacterium]
MKIAVIGGGSWATALVKLISDKGLGKGIELTWWLRRQESIEHLKKYKHNPDYLSSVVLPTEQINLTTSLPEAIADVEMVILAIPSAFLYDQLQELPEDAFQGKWVASAIKGVVPQTYEVVGTYLKNRFKMPEKDLLVIGGPCHAEEVALEKLSFLTIASGSQASADKLAAILESRFLKTSTSLDLYGTEYGAVLKNVYAIASGICHGLGYGDNFQAVLMSQAIKEMEYFLDQVSPMERDVNDHVYLGDLLVTAYSQFSRNRTFGNMIGKGYSVKFAQLEMNMVAEGYYATKSMHELLWKLKINMPILEAVYNIIYQNAIPKNEARRLIETFD